MKTSLSLLLCCVLTTSFAQEPKAPGDPLPPPAPEAIPAPDKPPRVSKPRRVETTVAPGGALTFEADGGRVTVKSSNKFESDSVLPRSARTGRTMVIQTSGMDPEVLADAEEDLSVMGLILRKATGARAEEKRQALGIEIDSSLFGSSSGARNIYVEGHGALFLLGVRFPLVAPAEKEEEVKSKDTRSTDWQDAHEELVNEGMNSIEEKLIRAWSSSRRNVEEYDAAKVDALKMALLSALKNATHIRAVKPNEYVTVVIQGAESIRADKPAAGRGGSSKSSSRSDRRGETVMTLRAKKSDVDAFAEGKMDFEKFSKAVPVQTYFRKGEASVSTSPFFPPLAK